MGGNETPEESASKQLYEPSHSLPPAEMLQAWKHWKLRPSSNDKQRAVVPNASVGQSAVLPQDRVHIRSPAAVTLKQSVPPMQLSPLLQDA